MSSAIELRDVAVGQSRRAATTIGPWMPRTPAAYAHASSAVASENPTIGFGSRAQRVGIEPRQDPHEAVAAAREQDRADVAIARASR